MNNPLVIRLLQDFRASILAREDEQLARMAREWLRIEAELQDDMFILAQQITDAKANGLPITEQLIAKQDRYRILNEQLKQQVLKYAKDKAVADIAAEQLAYAKIGIEAAQAAIKASYTLVPSFRLLSVDALQDMIGMLGDGTPLYRLLKEAYPDALDGVVKGLLKGIARGIGPNQIAKEMSDGMGMGLERILLISRTEQLRMWRTSTARQYDESGVVLYSKRLATKDDRVCPACLFSDGEIIPLGQVLEDHPRGRCTSVPVVKNAPEITWQPGKDWFLEQPQATQKDMLGPGMYDLWKKEGFDLNTLVGVAHSDVWGDSPRVKTLKELIAAIRT